MEPEDCAECSRGLTDAEIAKPARSGLGKICDRCAAGRFPKYPPKFWCDVCGFSHALEPRPCEA